METNLFEPVTPDKKQIFPDLTKKNQSQAEIATLGAQLYDEFFNDPNMHTLLGRALKQGQEELLVCRNDLPATNETEIFLVLTITREKKIIHKIQEQQYRA
jgi:hypothetical protein